MTGVVVGTEGATLNRHNPSWALSLQLLHVLFPWGTLMGESGDDLICPIIFLIVHGRLARAGNRCLHGCPECLYASLGLIHFLPHVLSIVA